MLKNLGESNNKFQDYDKHPNESSFSLKGIEPDEIYKLLWKVNIKQARGICGLSPKLIEISAEKIKEPLALIFNMSFKNGVFPEKLKYGVVFPIYTGEYMLTCSNYRPVPILSETLEKVMRKRRFQYLNKFDMLYEHQFGFQ